MVQDDGSPSLGVVRTHFEFKETAATIIAEGRFVPLARQSIFDSRDIIERFIALDPFFKDTLEPYEPPWNAHPLIKRMCAAAKKADVGPMAAVAGAIAEEAVNSMVAAGARQAVVDNGGDIAMFLSEPLKVALYTGTSRIQDIGFNVPADNKNYAICTSSGTIGPSISFGIADAAVVFAADAALADACATRLGNEVKDRRKKAILNAIKTILHIEGVEGALVIVGDKLVMSGKLPELVKMKADEGKIAKIGF